MKISIITLFPEMINGFFSESIIKRAVEKGAVEIEIVNLRDFAIGHYGTVDDRPYGGGAGMVMRIDVLANAILKVKKSHVDPLNGTPQDNQKIVLTSAKGKRYNQEKAKELSQLNHLIILCGHYEGVDERIMDYIDEEISLGDFVMTGGEITAAAIADSIVRLLPGVLKKNDAAAEESFFQVSIDELTAAIGDNNILRLLKTRNQQQVTLLEYPHYTRPEEYEGKKIPEILRSGNPKKIRAWKLRQSFEQTQKKRPDLLYTSEV